MSAASQASTTAIRRIRQGDFVHVSENADSDPNTVQTLETCIGVEGPAECTGTPGDGVFNNNYFVNDVHGVVITYTNVFAGSHVCDFSTFGGFVLRPTTFRTAVTLVASSGFRLRRSQLREPHERRPHPRLERDRLRPPGHRPAQPVRGFATRFGLGSVNGVAGERPSRVALRRPGEPAKKVGDAVYLMVGGVVLIPEQVVVGGNIQLHPKCKKAPKAEKH